MKSNRKYRDMSIPTINAFFLAFLLISLSSALEKKISVSTKHTHTAGELSKESTLL